MGGFNFSKFKDEEIASLQYPTAEQPQKKQRLCPDLSPEHEILFRVIKESEERYTRLTGKLSSHAAPFGSVEKFLDSWKAELLETEEEQRNIGRGR